LKNISDHKSGFVTLLGKPNAGKSTLLNALLGRKLSIITPKAQTTRHRIFGIETGEGYQIVYSDTPGVIKPKYRLHERMMGAVTSALQDADVLVLLLSMEETHPEEDLLQSAANFPGPVIVVLNKADLRPDAAALEARWQAARAYLKPVQEMAISALHNQGVEELRQEIIRLLPEGPPYYEPDQISDRPERFFVAEIIREKIFLLLKEEIPYSAEVEIVQYDESDTLDKIYATIHVERITQKGIVIGKGGAMLKRIGMEARKDIELFLEKKVYLELYVKVSEDWKNHQGRLRSFGYE
jgi:GTP-binding protein Era